MTLDQLPVLIACAVAAGSLVLMVGLLLSGRGATVDARVDDVRRPSKNRGQMPNAMPNERGVMRVGQIMMPKEAGKQQRLRSRLQQAGLYRRHAMTFFMGVKFLSMVIPMAVGVIMSFMGLIDLVQAVILGAFVGGMGGAIPSIWLSQLKKGRQRSIRRAMPDALDVIVVCLEGGLSLPGALSRVASELNQAHPLLAEEMAIVRREIQLGPQHRRSVKAIRRSVRR